MNNWLRLSALLFFLSLYSCTTIEIKESDVFDIKRTITPDHFDIKQMSLEVHQTELSDSVSLETWSVMHEDATATVIYYGGNGFSLVLAREILETYSELAVNVVMHDYRGYGRNEGIPTIEHLKSDALAIYDSFDPDVHPVVLHGHSMGSLIATYVAENRAADALILESPITNADHMASLLVPALLKPFIRFDVAEVIRKENNLERIAGLELPSLFVVGDEDQVTPKAMAEKLHRNSPAQQKTLQIIHGGGHNSLPGKNQFRIELENFLGQIHVNASDTGF